MNEHQRLAWASTSGEKTLEKTIFTSHRACDEALQILFKANYFTGKQSLPYSKFLALCKLIIYVNAPITASMYQDEKFCIDLISCISTVIQKKIICRFRNSPLFGIIVDESTDISATGHLVMFAIIVKEGLPITMFLGLFKLDGGKNIELQFFIVPYPNCGCGIWLCASWWPLVVMEQAAWWVLKLAFQHDSAKR